MAQEIWQYGIDEVRRLKALEAENACLRKLPVDRDLEIEVMKRRSAQKNDKRTRYALHRGVSQRRACAHIYCNGGYR